MQNLQSLRASSCSAAGSTLSSRRLQPAARRLLQLSLKCQQQVADSAHAAGATEDWRQRHRPLLAAVAGLAAAASLLLGPADVAQARPALTPDEKATIQLYQRSKPSVVYITSLTNSEEEPEEAEPLPIPAVDMYLMARRRDAFTLNMMEIPQGEGSGFVYDREGHIVTNYHVIRGAAEVMVTLTGAQGRIAQVVGFDEDKDVAVLKVDPKDLETPLVPLQLGESSDLMVGQRVFAIGQPFGLQLTLTTGVISGTGREITSGNTGRPIQDVIQTDAAINPGNSGGPLLDSSGSMIGINTAIYSQSGNSAGVGFAIPVDVVKSSVDQIIKFGKVVRPIMGITFAPDQSVEQLGVQGVLVLNAKDGGPAAKAGVKGSSRDEYGRLILGDIILSINGKRINNASDLYRILDKSGVGDKLDVEVLRADTTEHLTITLEANA